LGYSQNLGGRVTVGVKVLGYVRGKVRYEGSDVRREGECLTFINAARISTTGSYLTGSHDVDVVT